MSRLTLSQAQDRLTALVGPDSLIDPAAIDWTQPDREAVTIAGLVQSTDDLDERANIVAVCLALTAYAAHLAFEEGRAFELAAVKRAAKAAWEDAADAGAVTALHRLGELLADGLHHAEPAEPAPTPQIGDVWRIGLMVASDAEVRCVHPETGNLTVAGCHGDRRHKVVSAAKFTTNRRLVRREGKEV